MERDFYVYIEEQKRRIYRVAVKEKERPISRKSEVGFLEFEILLRFADVFQVLIQGRKLERER